MEVFEKSQTVDPEVRAYIYSLVNAVGGQSTLEDRYAIGDDALAVLNDLLRWLRLYDEKTHRFDVKRCLAEANLVKGDLLEILALWPEDQQENKLKAKLALACLQLLVPLTWPIELEEDKTTVNHLRHLPYLQLAQVGYKRAVLQHEDADILRTIIRIALPSMAQERRERSKRDEGIIKLCLYFLRNVAMIHQPQHLPSQGNENDISRSSTIDAFQQQDVFSLLLTVASGANDDFQEQDVIVLQALFHLVKGVDPRKLFLQSTQLVNEETTELQNLIKKEKAMLNSYNKHAPTRHNRFGTMLWVKREDDKMSTVTGQATITNDSTTLLQMDKSKKWDKPRQRGKKSADEFKESEQFGGRVDLTESARKHLVSFIEDFLDSGFNPLFSGLRKAIEREAERVGDANKIQYFYLISWFLSAEAARREQKGAPQITETAGDNTYAYIAAVLDQETFVLLNRHMQNAFDEKRWRDLQASLMCFTQILLTVQKMADSADEEDQEIAENIQNRIFYEESTQDRIVQILRGYSNQGFAYLNAVTECVHVFVRMLEKYSKVNVDLQVRSKRRARRKKKTQQTPQEPASVPQQDTDAQDGELRENNNEDEDNAADDEEDDHFEAQLVASERKFDFVRFSSKFTSQPCVDTFISLLHFYADLDADQLKRCHRYLYRLAFKNDMFVLLFRVDILALLHKMIKGPDGLSCEIDGFKSWEQLVQQIFRKCVKWIERQTEGKGWRETAVVEMLFSKISNTVYYLQNGFDRVIEQRAPRPPAELEFKSAVAKSQHLRVAVSVMLERDKGDELTWTKNQVKRAAEERQAWEHAEEERQRINTEDGAVDGSEKPSPPAIFLTPEKPVEKISLFKDKFLRLLLTAMRLQRLGTAEDVDASWIFPPELTADTLRATFDEMERAEFAGPMWDDEGRTGQDLIRNKSTAQTEATHPDHNEPGSDREIDNPLFPPNLREKRKRDTEGDEPEEQKKKRRLERRNRTELTDKQAQAKAEERRRKERERNSKIKSQLFVTASDDESDEEGDAAFFRLEEERRKKMKGFIRSALLKEAAAGLGASEGRKRKRRSKKAKKMDSDEDVGTATATDVDMDSEASDARSPARLEISSDSSSSDSDADAEASDEETPLSTSPPAAMDGAAKEMPLAEVSGNGGSVKTPAAKHVVNTVDEEDDDDDDDEPVVFPAARRRMRAGFILDSDSE